MFNFTDMPEQPNLLSHRIEAQGTAPQRSFDVVFDYPDCVRIFNGKEWRVEAKAAFVQKMNDVDLGRSK